MVAYSRTYNKTTNKNGSSFNKEHRAIPFLHINEKGEIVTNLDEIKKILTDPAVKDLKVAVISVAGKYRKGKSFLLNFFLRYLYANSVDKQGDAWMGSDDEELEGFAWKLQSERVTTGILIWSKIFIIEVENEKIAIILMDTQGTFDDEHIMEEHTKIFAMTTLLSSFEIYNLMQNIEEDDLQNLALFTTYAEKLHEKSDFKMGQQLQFLVRDWSYPHEFPFGLKGGEQNLAKKLNVSNRKPAFVRVREALKSSYEDISCYLLPHPGTKVLMDPNSKGKISTMDEMFVKHLKQYVPYVFSGKNIKPKTFNGTPIEVSGLVRLIEKYANICAEGEKNGVKMMDIFEMYVRTTFDFAQEQAFELYKINMLADSKIYETIGSFNYHHKISKKAAKDHFCNTPISGSDDIKQKYEVNLDKEIECLYNSLRMEMFSKNFFETAGEAVGSFFGAPVGGLAGAFTLDMALGGAGTIGLTVTGVGGAVIGICLLGAIGYKIARQMSLKQRFKNIKRKFVSLKKLATKYVTESDGLK